MDTTDNRSLVVLQQGTGPVPGSSLHAATTPTTVRVNSIVAIGVLACVFIAGFATVIVFLVVFRRLIEAGTMTVGVTDPQTVVSLTSQSQTGQQEETPQVHAKFAPHPASYPNIKESQSSNGQATTVQSAMEVTELWYEAPQHRITSSDTQPPVRTGRHAFQTKKKRSSRRHSKISHKNEIGPDVGTATLGAPVTDLDLLGYDRGSAAHVPKTDQRSPSRQSRTSRKSHISRKSHVSQNTIY